VTKDAIRDQLKEETDSLQAAETLYETWSRNDSLWPLFDDIDTRVGKLQESIQKGSIPKATANNLETDEFVHRLNLITKWNHYLLNSLSPLIEKKPEFRQQYEELDKGFNEMEVRQAEVSSELQKSQNVERSEEEHIALLNRALRGMGNVDIFGKVKEFMPNLILNFEIEKERKAKLYKIFTWLSYVLYTAGWGLALVGRLAGDGNSSNE
jgi:hypothetical protein